MRLRVFARALLSDVTPPLAVPTLLLEGSWAPPAPDRWSLDEAIDGRLAWIDQQAAELADRLAPPPDAAGPSAWPLYLNAVDLRYHLVKLLRVVAYFTEVRPLAAGDTLELIARRPGDQLYADLLRQLAAGAGAELWVRWVTAAPAAETAFPGNGLLRRWAGRLAAWLDGFARSGGSGPRVVCCGEPQVLDPVCHELLSVGAAVWWLHDRFAPRAWLKGRWRGVRQLLCNSSRGRHSELLGELPGVLDCRGVNLTPLVARWLSDRMLSHGGRQSRLLEQVRRHFARVRPEVVVLDEDASPLARAAVALGRQSGAASLVVQHAAPVCRFDVAPLAADRILAWGRSSRRQLLRWGIPAERIAAVGSPRQEQLAAVAAAAGEAAFHGDSKSPGQGGAVGGPLRVLLLSAAAPRDDRPGAVTLHLTTASYRQMLRTAFSALAARPKIELTVRLHPQSPRDAILASVLAEFPSLSARVVHKGAVEQWLAGVDCVLSCDVTAGAEAAVGGIPVIGLLPAGAHDQAIQERWGLAGIARGRDELAALLGQVVLQRRRGRAAADPEVFEQSPELAAVRIAQECLAARSAPAAEAARQAVAAEAPASTIKAA